MRDGYLRLALAIIEQYVRDVKDKRIRNKMVKYLMDYFDLTMEDLAKLRAKESERVRKSVKEREKAL